ncbi:MAG: hypothetical protein WC755_01810 [Candidatus Woesearchaeota archaeon]|jgi:hypothetical protein
MAEGNSLQTVILNAIFFAVGLAMIILAPKLKTLFGSTSSIIFIIVGSIICGSVLIKLISTMYQNI